MRQSLMRYASIVALVAALFATSLPANAATSVVQHQHASGHAFFGSVRLSGTPPTRQRSGRVVYLHLHFTAWGCCWPDDALLSLELGKDWHIGLNRVYTSQGWRYVGTCPNDGDNVPVLIPERGIHRTFIEIENGSCQVDIPLRPLEPGHFPLSVALSLRHIAAKDGVHPDLTKLRQVSPSEHLVAVAGVRVSWQVTITR